MQALVENLNHVGGLAREFAWPMLWQSSLLTGLVFLLDWGLRHRVRAAVRYALWWLVLIKLVLPPSLALPTGLGWWLRSPGPAPQQARASAVVVAYEAASAPSFPTPAPTAPVAPPREPLSAAAVTLLITSSISLGLLLWMLVRWYLAVRALRSASAPPAWLEQVLDAERRALGLSRPLRLRLLDQAVSPAVCGLFHPIILLPRVLVDQLAAAQLRAVLVHELVHLRRADVWANCLQAVLQVLYWWHPLLWLANARIRRLREEAVDDAVLLALHEDAETYAPTLLQVAKLALQRPLATLGLVGILESRSFLRQRIERLLDGQPPRNAGLSVASALCVLALGAFALPMGQEPATSPALATAPATVTVPLFNRIIQVDAESFLSGLRQQAGLGQSNAPGTKAQALRVFCQRLGVELAPPKSIFLNEQSDSLFVRASVQELDLIEAEILKHNLRVVAESQPPAPRPVKASELIAEGIELYEQRKWNEAEARLILALREDPQNQVGRYYLRLAAEARHEHNTARTNATTNSTSTRTNLILTGKGRQGVVSKLDHIRLKQVAFQALPLSQVMAQLAEESRKCDPEGKGVRFGIFSNQPPAKASIDPTTGHPAAAEANPVVDIATVPITIQPPLTEIRLGDALDAVIRATGSRIKYLVEDEGILFSVRTGKELQPLYTRMIKVDPNTFVAGLRNSLGLTGPADFKALHQNLRDFFTGLGIDLAPPKSIFFNEKEGTLVVRAFLQDLDTIETATQVLNMAPPQVNIKGTFLEIAEESVAEFFSKLGISNACGTNGGATILTAAQVRQARQIVQTLNSVDVLEMGSVTMPSGRQAQLATFELTTMVTGLNPQALQPPGIPAKAEGSNDLYQTTTIPCGPSLDVEAQVAADGYTVCLTSIASVTEFLGYNKPTNSPAVYVNGKQERAVLPLPQLRVRSMTNSAVLWDGHTVMLGGPVAVTVKVLKEKTPVLGDLPFVGKLFRSESRTSKKKHLFVLITPTIIDPRGNRVHSDEEVTKVSESRRPQ